MQPAMQRALNRVRHEDFHLPFAQIFNMVVERPVLELFALTGAHCFLETLEAQEIFPP